MFRFTIRDVLWLTVVVALAHHGKALADIVGPTVTTVAVSPDGNLIVRMVRNGSTNENEAYDVVYFEYARAKDRYERASSYVLSGGLSQMLFVSDDGDLVLINLDEKEAVRLYSRDGATRRSWDLSKFLSKSEIRGCAETGSTLQWFDDGKFVGREFHFRGPSHIIRALQPSFTIMRPANRNVSFSGTLNAKAREIQNGR
jgi:hypothetical protein